MGLFSECRCWTNNWYDNQLDDFVERYVIMLIFEIFSPLKPTIESISQSDHDFIIMETARVFADHFPASQMKDYLNNTVDWKLSKKLMINGEIAGFYLLSENNVNDVVPTDNALEDLTKYNNLRGIEGIALVVLPKYRNMGFGNLLKTLPRNLGYDYIFGMQLKSLKNLEDWLKRRRLVGDVGSVWVTLEDLQ